MPVFLMVVKCPEVSISGIGMVLGDKQKRNWRKGSRKPPTNRGLSTRHIESNVTSFYGARDRG